MILIIIQGNPIPWTPSRVLRNGRAYSPRYYEKRSHQIQIRHQWKEKPLSGPISLSINFYLPIPKGASKKFLRSVYNSEVLHTKKPDTSNLVKYAEDCLKEIVIQDDNQVVEIHARKFYSLAPKTIIKIYPVDNEDQGMYKVDI